MSSSDFADLAGRYVVLAILGVLGGFVSPWLKHVFGVRASRHKNRCELIAKWREELCSDELYFGENGSIFIPNMSCRLLRQKSSYSALEPRLSPQATESLKRYGGNTLMLVIQSTDNPVRLIIVNEIARLE